MTQDQFITEITVPADNRNPDVYEAAFRRVRERLRGFEDRARFDILFPISVKAQWNAPSAPAAQLLRELSPVCPLSCEEAVRALLSDWDISIEEVPFYIAARFGVARVRQAVDRLASERLADSEMRNLKAVSYWIDRYEEAYPNGS